MTTSEAKSISKGYILDWCEVSTDLIEESIRGGLDDEAIEALDLVGFDFPWSIKVEED